jgi:hypothetical protein
MKPNIFNRVLPNQPTQGHSYLVPSQYPQNHSQILQNIYPHTSHEIFGAIPDWIATPLSALVSVGLLVDNIFIK